MTAGIESLDGFTTTPEAKYAVTLGLLLLAIIGTALLKWVGPRLKRYVNDTLVEIGQTLVVALLWTVMVGALVVTWDASDQVWAAVSVLAITQTQTILAVVSLLVVVAAYTTTRLTRRWIARLAEGRSAITGHEQQIAHHFIQIVIYIAAGLVVLSLWEIPIGNLLLGAGFLGVVLGLAARQTLGALLAGFVVLLARPFEIGDWVEIGDKEGIVSEITVFNTRLQSFDGEYVMVPNDMVTAQEVVNRSKKGRLREEIEVGVDYTTDIEKAVAVARKAVGNVETVLSVPQPRVVGKRFGDSSVVLGVRFWIDKPSARRQWRARTQVVEAIAGGFREADIKIPFPQRELSGRAETEGLQVALGTEQFDADESTNDGNGNDEEQAEEPAESDEDGQS